MTSKVSGTDQRAVPAVSGTQLCIGQSEELSAPSPQHQLLLGFYFGSDAARAGHPAVVDIGIDPIDRAEIYESWWYEGEVSFTVDGTTTIAQCDDYAVVTVQVPDTAPDKFRACTYEVYKELMRAARTTGHRRLVRIWNYFGEINAGDGDDEKYRQFSIGRAQVFEELGIQDEMVPAGTAIGSVRESAFTVIALVSKHHFQNVENPRQVSAFRYPPVYGPKSPKFSRAGCVSVADQRLFLISGTAAIVGHESVHAGDVGLQTEETLNNLQGLCDAISAIASPGVQLTLDDEAVLRVYMRNSNDLEVVAAKLQKPLGAAGRNIAFLNADICRRELMVEIDGAKTAVVPK